jgi:hypothetical protein
VNDILYDYLSPVILETGLASSFYPRIFFFGFTIFPLAEATNPPFAARKAAGR